MFNKSLQQFILSLAHRSIEHFFDTGKILKIKESELPSVQFSEKRACFVTLTLDGNLRGCIGHIEPIQPLYLDIIENAMSSAFEDPRFNQLTREEFKNVEIEVSVLTVPQELFFANSGDLLMKLQPNVDGVIIQRGRLGATYLPQVWERFESKEDLMSSLCQKAGLSADDWKNFGLNVQVYQAEVIKNTEQIL